jgi:hypothetical protein
VDSRLPSDNSFKIIIGAAATRNADPAEVRMTVQTREAPRTDDRYGTLSP